MHVTMPTFLPHLVTRLENGEVKGAGCVLGGGKGELKERKLSHKRPDL